MRVFVVRTIRFLWLSFLFLPIFFFCFLFYRKAGPRVVYWYFQSLGAAFVKLGQFLATRYDLLPASYCETLSTLLDDLPPEPGEKMIAVIESAFSYPIAECFAEFDIKPIASASVAQVHGATLHTGESVVVKVLRPGIKQRFRVDFFYFRCLAWFWDRLKIFSRIEIKDIVGALEKLSREEMDFRREARTIHQMHGFMKSDDIDHYAPNVYFSFCKANIIVMERIEGVPATQLIEAIENQDKTLLRQWEKQGIDPRRSAYLLLRSLLEQTYRHRTFHVDPHAGNIIIMPGGTLAWLDFGMIGWLDERIWLQQFKLREAMSAKEIHRAYQNLIATLEPLPPGKDLSRFELELKGFLYDWITASNDPNATLAEKSSGYFLLRSFDAIRKAGLSLPFNVLRLYRSMIISDMVMLKLDSTIDWLQGIQDFVTEESQRQIGILVKNSLSLPNTAAAFRASLNLPRAAMELVDWMQNRLPEMGRSYQDQLSRFEQALFMSTRYLRTLLVSGALLLLGSRLIAPYFFPQSWWENLSSSLGLYWWPLLILAGLTIIFLERLIAAFRRS